MVPVVKRIALLVLLFFFFLNFAQKRHSDIPAEVLKKGYTQYNTNSREKILKDYFHNAIQVKDYLPKNFSKLGDVDYTGYLQNAINSGNNIVMPDFPILINEKGLQLRSNSKIFFPEKSILIIKPNDKDGYQALMMDNIDNVEVYFPTIIGDADKHLGKTGEWGMGILLRNSHNIKIINPQISKCWGDGIYIGAQDGKFSSNILIDNALLDSNRRNAISVISAKKLVIQNSLLANTLVTSPNFGIDLEPNNNTNILEDIVISNNTTYNNKVGVGIVLDMLIGKNIHNMNIAIVNHTDYKSNTGIEFFVDRGYSKESNSNLKGKILINNLTTNDSDNSVILNKSKSVPNLNIYASKISSNKNGKTIKTPQENIQIFNSGIKKGQKVIL